MNTTSKRVTAWAAALSGIAVAAAMALSAAEGGRSAPGSQEGPQWPRSVRLAVAHWSDGAAALEPSGGIRLQASGPTEWRLERWNEEGTEIACHVQSGAHVHHHFIGPRGCDEEIELTEEAPTDAAGNPLPLMPREYFTHPDERSVVEQAGSRVEEPETFLELERLRPLLDTGRELHVITVDLRCGLDTDCALPASAWARETWAFDDASDVVLSFRYAEDGTVLHEVHATEVVLGGEPLVGLDGSR